MAILLLYLIGLLIAMTPTTCDQNCYEKLGVDKQASTKEIQKVFRKLAMKYHPDKIQGTEEEKLKSENKFKELARCYEILSNEDERKKYDMSDFNEKYNQQSSTSHFDNANFNDIFSRFFKSGDGNTFFRFSTNTGGQGFGDSSGGEHFSYGGYPGFDTFSQNSRSQHQQHQQQQQSSHGSFHQQHQPYQSYQSQQSHQPQQNKIHKEIVYVTLQELMDDNIKNVKTKDRKKTFELKIEKGTPDNYIIKKENYEFEIRTKDEISSSSSSPRLHNFVRGEKSHKSDLYYTYPLKLEDLLMENIVVNFKNIDDEEISFVIRDISELHYNQNGILQYKLKKKGLPLFKSENKETRGDLYVQFYVIYPILNEKQKTKLQNFILSDNNNNRQDILDYTYFQKQFKKSPNTKSKKKTKLGQND